MTPEELTDIRLKVGFNIAQMHRALGVPRSTYDRWQYGTGSMPRVAVSAVRMLEHMHKYPTVVRDWIVKSTEFEIGV